MKKSILLHCFIGLAIIASAQAGSPDLSFGINGIQTTGIKANFLYEEARKVLPSTNGSFFVVLNLGGKTVISKYLNGGTIDSSYGTDGYSELADFPCVDAALDNDGKIVVAGSTIAGIFVARYLVNGSLDKSFANNGVRKIPFDDAFFVNAVSVAIQNDKIVVVGNESTSFYDDSWNIVLIRLNHDGGGGILQRTNFALGPAATTLEIQDDGKYLVGAIMESGSLILRYNYDGSLDQGFGIDGMVTTEFGTTDLAMQGEKIVAAAPGNNGIVIARYNADGSLDNSFGEDGKITAANLNTLNKVEITALAIQGDKIVISYGGFRIARLNADGSLDNSFSGDGISQTFFNGYDFAQSYTSAIDGDKIIVAGLVYAYNSGLPKQDFAIARYNMDGSLDLTFSEDGMLVDFYPYSRMNFTNIALQQDGKILAVGTAYTGTGRNNADFLIVRYNSDGSLDKAFSEDGIQTTNFGNLSVDNAKAVALQGDKIVVVGSTYSPEDNNNINFAIARYNADGSPDNTFGVNGIQITDFGNHSNDFANAIAVSGDKIVVAGYSFSFSITGLSFAIARYNYDGSPDNTFDQDGLQTTHFGLNSSDIAETVAIQGDKIIVAGNSQVLNITSPKFAISRYNWNGTLDDTFDQDGKLLTEFFEYTAVFATAIVINGDKITVSGYGFGATAGTSGFAIAHYNPDGSLDNTFNDDGKLAKPFPLGDLNTTIKSVIYQENGKILVAATNSIVQYNADGTIDNSFGTNGVQTTGIDNKSISVENIVSDETRLYAIGNYRVNEYITKGIIAAYLLSEDIQLSCPGDTTVATGEGTCSAVVTNIDPVIAPAGSNSAITYTISGATIGTGTGTANGLSFNKGLNDVTYSVTSDPSKNCTFKVLVEDKEAPTITDVSANPNSLWPPNHQMVDVTINYNVIDNCGKVSNVLSVTSNQPNIGNDWQVIDAHHVSLRAERLGNAARIYTVTITASDDAGNQSKNQVIITVPQNNSGNNNLIVEANALKEENITSNKTLSGLTVSVTPNPTTYDFKLGIQSNNNQQVFIKVVDVSGRIIEKKQNIIPNTSMKLGTNYYQGVYFVEVLQGNKKVVLKLIKLSN